MFRALMKKDLLQEEAEHREGDLYKVVNVHGKLFWLYYGYYEECDRINPLVPSVPIYPDLSQDPQYTDDGFAVVTMMQDACQHFAGKAGQENDCSGCIFFNRCEEFFGICTCAENKSNANRL